MKAPCKDCPRRTLTCHASCEEYQEFKREREQAIARRGEESEMTGYVIGAMLRIRGRKKT